MLNALKRSSLGLGIDVFRHSLTETVYQLAAGALFCIPVTRVKILLRCDPMRQCFAYAPRLRRKAGEFSP
jgi:hypothetical protein